MTQHGWGRRRFLAACGLAPFALAGCGESAQEKVSRDLYEIGQALHNLHCFMDRFPRAGTPDPATEEGRGLMQRHWRVAILPYNWEEGLFKEIERGKFGEKYWQSEELAGRCPKWYAAGTGAEAKLTRYRAFVGEGTPLQANRNTSIVAITDGSRITLLVVAAEE